MDKSNQILDSITKWAGDEENIRFVALIGSLAAAEQPDRLAGIDLDIFTRDPQRLIDQNGWETQFGEPWLTKWTLDEALFLWNAVYADGLLLAFYIQPMSILAEIQVDLPPYYLPSYRVLVDKDDQAKLLPPAKASQPEKPKPEIFLAVLKQFWLDAYYVVRYLWRGELWRAKHYDWELKQHTLRMLCWHSTSWIGCQAVNIQEGANLRSWVDAETYADLAATFGRFVASDAWRALRETVALFSRLAREVAPRIEATYPAVWEQKFNKLFENLKANPKE
ncbi:aminoglycoside 6-adenylyltransferase [bacterium]|nr:aminoglycoside 6-adenylyltransferase [bacterium]